SAERQPIKLAWRKIVWLQVPKQAYDLGMSSLVDVETFKDILSFQYKLNPKTLYKDCIKAIEYYLSNDDFLDE
ncbi:hypothetical protein DW862_14605, partial [Bacteroides sp. AM37-9]